MQELKETKLIINEINIKKSRFLCLLQKVTSEHDALEFIKTNQQPNAAHNCYAYIIGKNCRINDEIGQKKSTLIGLIFLFKN
ncbi:YigZ family protein [Spiroplasma endosymbiont of Ammophila pubescens]|uniref:YigZ family protein n=1 Tax=Spiroplasma endosymbiont of Ammophila pubescens TaxID=3066315 RepID=UPI0032B1CF7C